MRTVMFKKLRKTAIRPTRGSTGAAGWDLYFDSDDERFPRQTAFVEPHCTKLFGTGIAVAIPEGYYGAVFARSGIASKRGLRPANCVGVIDSDYRGEIIVALHNDSNEIQHIENGERIAQLVIMPYANIDLVETEELDDTERGDGGFGSTGEK